MSYFDKIAPALTHRAVVDCTEFTREWLGWRSGIEQQVSAQEKLLDAALERAKQEDEEALEKDLATAIQQAGETPLDFAAFLPAPSYPEARAAGEQLQVLRKAAYTGPRWTLQWAELSTDQASRAIKNGEILARRHPEWDARKIGLVAYMAAHHEVQAGEPAPGELYETLATKSEFAPLWRYLCARFLEEFPEMNLTQAADLKNVFCGRALASAVGATPQS